MYKAQRIARDEEKIEEQKEREGGANPLRFGNFVHGQNIFRVVTREVTST